MTEKTKKLPKNWKWVRLGDICDFIGGMQPPKSVFSNKLLQGYVRLVQIQDFRRSDFAVYIPQEEAKRTFEQTDVMIGRYGPPVFQILRGLSGAYNVALMKTAPNADAITKDFLFYLLKESSIQNAVISQSQRSAGQSGVQREFVENLIVPLPSLTEQKRIVAILNEQMAAVEKARAAAEAQLQAAKTLPAAYLREVFDSPEAQKWERKKLGNIALIVQNGIYKSAENYGHGYPFIRMYNLQNNSWRLLLDPLAKVSLTDSELAAFQLEVGDLLISRVNSFELVGKCAWVDLEAKGYVFENMIIRLRLTDEVDSLFIAQQMGHSKIREQIQAVTKRAIGQASINSTDIRNIEVLLPELSEQEKNSASIAQKDIEIDKLQRSLQDQLNTIKQLPAALLRQAFNGEL